MAQVIFENVYKSFPRRKTEQNTTSDGSKAIKSQPNQNSVNVLRNINLTVEDGEFMVLVGQSGCGKSTLLRLLAGLETLTGGNIYIGDRSVQSLPPKARDIAMVFQNYALYPHLDVYNNIAFGLRRSQQSSTTKQKSSSIENTLVGMTRNLPRNIRYVSSKEKEISKQVKSVARLLQIEPLLSRLPKELSGGQKQRVALGRAIARNPQVFLMDEPLSNLDAKLRTETRGQIVQLQKQLDITTIYVTHDQTEAMTMGDRIAVMNQGQIQQVAKPLEVYNHPANLFVAGFIGSPPMNLLSVDWVGNSTLQHPQFKLTLPIDWSQLLRDSNTRSLVLGIRPQHFTITDAETRDFSVTVDSVEALGNETYIYSSLDTQTPLTISIFSDRLIHPGENLPLKINPDKIHLFNANTGESIQPCFRK
ncbi:sn-glycerol-3-phosphate import ATP-binding protein UgpC [Hyella patelloides LEGE 07179]|uniref:sn-glycerol-3-phosphate import ATP-binding protein UgpC n=1 Tax=Hyella patelloides LEGE 07179 TaxID=945734 RepID=A0A563VKZ8_9CYAN|nr:ABC transporter ATP-binding protein [Hyella patelloides]VEP12124.1 sn-glycerol-3-phosphate import ATP-binding protein UgpC [Hyella patelloides LEGE 07179]